MLNRRDIFKALLALGAAPAVAKSLLTRKEPRAKQAEKPDLEFKPTVFRSHDDTLMVYSIRVEPLNIVEHDYFTVRRYTRANELLLSAHITPLWYWQWIAGPGQPIVIPPEDGLIFNMNGPATVMVDFTKMSAPGRAFRDYMVMNQGK